MQDGDIGFASIYLFVGRDFLISVRDPTCVSNEILQRASKAGPEERPSKLLYLIIDSIVDSYFVSIDHSDDRIDDLQDSVLDNPSPAILESLFDQKRKLIELRRVLVNLRDACMSLQRESGSILQPQLDPFFRDVYDHALRLLDMVETLRDLLNNTFDVYLSSVANRTNQVMKVLTVRSTIALPALVISGIYGMNLKGLPFLESGHGTEIVVGAMVASTGMVLWMLKRFGWLVQFPAHAFYPEHYSRTGHRREFRRRAECLCDCPDPGPAGACALGRIAARSGSTGQLVDHWRERNPLRGRVHRR